MQVDKTEMGFIWFGIFFIFFKAFCRGEEGSSEMFDWNAIRSLVAAIV